MIKNNNYLNLLTSILLGRLSFHGKNHMGTYYDQVEETKPYIERFVRERLPKFLKHFETVLEYNQGGDKSG